MHQTLRELPGPRGEMTAVTAHWDPATDELSDGDLDDDATAVCLAVS
jgi:hypothetical protein